VKALVVYSSLTGNTKAVAEAVAAGLGEAATLAPAAEAPGPEGFDIVVCCFWVDKGRADKASREYYGRLSSARTAICYTLGAYPDSEHADMVDARAREDLERNGNTVLGSFRSQGKVDPNLLELMKEKLPPDHPHAKMTRERRELLDEASLHPDAGDLKRARDFGSGLLALAG
jgi:flavodoxin